MSSVSSVGASSTSSASSTISIAGVNKASLLAALYNASKPLGFGRYEYVPGDMSVVEAQRLLGRGTHVDYHKGRPIQVDLSTDELDTRCYNEANGAGAAESIVRSLTAGEASRSLGTSPQLGSIPTGLTAPPPSPVYSTLLHILAPGAVERTDCTVRLTDGSTKAVRVGNNVYFDSSTVEELRRKGIPYPEEFFAVTAVGPVITTLGSMGGKFSFDANAGIVTSIM